MYRGSAAGEGLLDLERKYVFGGSAAEKGIPVSKQGLETVGSADGRGPSGSKHNTTRMRKHFDIICEKQTDALEAHHNLRPEAKEMIKSKHVKISSQKGLDSWNHR